LQTPPTIAPDIITADLRPDLFGERSLEREIDADLGNPAYCSAFGKMLRPKQPFSLPSKMEFKRREFSRKFFVIFPNTLSSHIPDSNSPV
jgi:hypothetical protein